MSNKVAVKWEKCQNLKAKESAKFGSHAFLAQHEVFAADAMHAFTVQAGLVGCYTAGEQRRIYQLRAYTVRAFVNAQEETYTVAGTVEVGQAVLPQILFGKHIKLGTSCTFEEYRGRQGRYGLSSRA